MPGHTINQLLTSPTSNSTRQLDMWKKVLMRAALLHAEWWVIDYSFKKKGGGGVSSKTSEPHSSDRLRETLHTVYSILALFFSSLQTWTVNRCSPIGPPKIEGRKLWSLRHADALEMCSVVLLKHIMLKRKHSNHCFHNYCEDLSFTFHMMTMSHEESWTFAMDCLKILLICGKLFFWNKRTFEVFGPMFWGL